MLKTHGAERLAISTSEPSEEAVATRLRLLVLEAIRILQEPDAQLKAKKTQVAASLWKQRQQLAEKGGCAQVPDRPGRDDTKVWHIHY